MTCECGSTRTMHLYLKHNDTAGISIPHLHLDMDGYLPYIGGGLGGDDTTLDICLDCGRIQDWEPISDASIMNDEKVMEILDEQREQQARELEEEAEKLRDLKNDRTPNVITISHLVKGSQDNCPICGQPWALHDHRTSTPTCPE